MRANENMVMNLRPVKRKDFFLFSEYWLIKKGLFLRQLP